MPEDCAAVWEATAPKERSEKMDAYSPQCGCEKHSLRGEGNAPVDDPEFVARILTSPGHFDKDSRILVAKKLTSVHSRGLSVVRQNATDEEIRLSVTQLLNASDEEELYGLAILRVSDIRGLSNGERWFCVYDTQDDGKTHHADLLGTTPAAPSKNAIDKAKSSRRHELADMLHANVHTADDVDDLISIFRRVCSTPA